MEPIEYPAIEWLSKYTRSTFQASCRRHLLITGEKGRGKTTLLEALLEGQHIPGLRSMVQRGEDGLPRQVILQERTGTGRCVIGRRDTGTMAPVPGVLDVQGAVLAQRVLTAPGEWAAIDEIGFLEESSPVYQEALWNIFEKKRVLAVLRKAELPFLRRISEREDCLLLDLDRMDGR